MNASSQFLIIKMLSGRITNKKNFFRFRRQIISNRRYIYPTFLLFLHYDTLWKSAAINTNTYFRIDEYWIEDDYDLTDAKITEQDYFNLRCEMEGDDYRTGGRGIGGGLDL